MYTQNVLIVLSVHVVSSSMIPEHYQRLIIPMSLHIETDGPGLYTGFIADDIATDRDC